MKQISENNLKLTDEVYNCSCLVELARVWDVIILYIISKTTVVVLLTSSNGSRGISIHYTIVIIQYS